MWDRDEGEERAGTYRKRCMIVVRPRCAHVGSAPQAKGEITSCRGEGPRPGSEMRGKDNVENTRSWNIEHNDTRRQLAQIPASSPAGHVRCSRRTRARCERRRAVGEDGSEIPEENERRRAGGHRRHSLHRQMRHNENCVRPARVHRHRPAISISDRGRSLDASQAYSNIIHISSISRHNYIQLETSASTSRRHYTGRGLGTRSVTPSRV